MQYFPMYTSYTLGSDRNSDPELSIEIKVIEIVVLLKRSAMGGTFSKMK